jgi:hypothetical protein
VVNSWIRSRASSSDGCLTLERLLTATCCNLHSMFALGSGTLTQVMRDRVESGNNY